MIDHERIGELTSAIVYDPTGAEVGNVIQVFVDDDWGAPTWVVVQTGIFGLSDALAPVYDALLDDGRLLIGVDRNTVKDAPRLQLRIDPSGHEVIDQRQVAELHHHYRLPYVFRGPQPPRTRIDRSQIQRSQHPTLQSPYEQPDRAIGVAQVTRVAPPVGVASVAGTGQQPGA
ncbi:MAG: PRC-barrel domain-containing protein, partial [Micromonosporaceae bacterium]